MGTLFGTGKPRQFAALQAPPASLFCNQVLHAISAYWGALTSSASENASPRL